MGRLCSQCEEGFTRNTQFKCAECPPLALNVSVLVILGTGSLGLLSLFIWLTLRSATKPRSNFSIYFRLVVSHVQLLMLVASFRFDWPGPVRSLLALFESVADAPQQLFSLDCLFQSLGGTTGL